MLRELTVIMKEGVKESNKDLVRRITENAVVNRGGPAVITKPKVPPMWSAQSFERYQE